MCPPAVQGALAFPEEHMKKYVFKALDPENSDTIFFSQQILLPYVSDKNLIFRCNFDSSTDTATPILTVFGTNLH